MTAEIVNLRRARKLKRRDDKETIAAANRAKYGLSAGQRDSQALASQRAVRLLDGHRREPATDGKEGLD